MNKDLYTFKADTPIRNGTKKTKTTTSTYKSTASVMQLNDSNPFAYCQTFFKANKETRDKLSHECRNFPWKTSTLTMSIAYFLNTFLNWLKNHYSQYDFNANPYPTFIDLTPLYHDLCGNVVGKENSNRNTDNTLINVHSQILRAEKIYTIAAHLLEKETEIVLPNLRLPILTNQNLRRVNREECKCLPHLVRQSFTRILLESVDSGEILGVAAMFFLGLRPSEASPVLFNDFKIKNGICQLIVDKIETQKSVENGSKSPKGTRLLIVPRFFQDLIEMRKEYLLNHNFTEDDISRMPIACKSINPTLPCGSQAISRVGKIMLLNAGISNSTYTAASTNASLEKFEPEDVASYILRRDFATRCLTHCGFPEPLLHRIMGHESDEVVTVDFTSADLQAKVSQMIERYVLNPAHTTSPQYNTLKVSNDPIDYTNTPFTNYRLQKEDNTVAHIECCATEPGQSISITLPAENEPPNIQWYQSAPNSAAYPLPIIFTHDE